MLVCGIFFFYFFCFFENQNMGDDSEYPPAYFLDDPSVSVSAATLKKLGVLSWRIDAANYEKEGKLDRIRSERGYKNHDFVLVKKKKKWKTFFFFFFFFLLFFFF